MAEVSADRPSQFLTFRLAGQLYALPADEVSEVIRVPPVARVPQGPPGLLGLGNLRGALLPIASGRGLLGQEEGEASRAIVLNGAAPVAVAVDQVEGLVTVERSRIVTEEAEIARQPGERLLGAFRADAQSDVAKVLDVWPLLNAAFVQAPPSRPAAGVGQVTSGGSRTAGPSVDAIRMVTFDVSGQEFALPLDDVREIIPAPNSLTAVHHSEALVLGVAAYRDTLLPLLSLQALLGLGLSSTAPERAKVLVVAFGRALAGLVVDRVRAVISANADQIEPPPPVLLARSTGETRVKAIYRGENGRRLISILSKDLLLREDVVQRLTGTDGRAEGAAVPMGDGDGQELRFLVFRLGDEEFGLPIEAVDEVARVPEHITRVPKTPAFLEGVINLRGEVLPVVDQRRRFDLPPAADAESRRLIVVRTKDQRAGLIVDSVSEVMRSTETEIQPAPELAGEATRLVKGVINLDAAGRLVLVLDPSELLTRAERGLLQAFQTDPGQTHS